MGSAKSREGAWRTPKAYRTRGAPTIRRLQDYAENVEALTIAEERSRISRDLHDDIGHRLTASIVQIDCARHLLGQYKTQQATRMLGNVHEQPHGALHELRNTVHALRSPEVTESSLTVLLQRLADEFTLPAHAKVHTSLPEALSPSPLTSRHLMRVLNRFFTYFCIVTFIFGTLELTIDLPGEGPALWSYVFLISFFVALAAAAFANSNRRVP